MVPDCPDAVKRFFFARPGSCLSEIDESANVTVI